MLRIIRLVTSNLPKIMFHFKELSENGIQITLSNLKKKPVNTDELLFVNYPLLCIGNINFHIQSL